MPIFSTFLLRVAGREVADLSLGARAWATVAARTSAGRQALPLLFNSAEAYVDTWRRAFVHRSERSGSSLSTRPETGRMF